MICVGRALHAYYMPFACLCGSLMLRFCIQIYRKHNKTECDHNTLTYKKQNLRIKNHAQFEQLQLNYVDN